MNSSPDMRSSVAAPETGALQTPNRDSGRRLRSFRPAQYIFRRFDGRMFSSDRYLATVRRAITMPFSDSIITTSWSDSGLSGSSAPNLDCRISNHQLSNADCSLSNLQSCTLQSAAELQIS